MSPRAAALKLYYAKSDTPPRKLVANTNSLASLLELLIHRPGGTQGFAFSSMTPGDFARPDLNPILDPFILAPWLDCRPLKASLKFCGSQCLVLGGLGHWAETSVEEI